MNNKYPIQVRGDQDFILRHSDFWLRGQHKTDCLIWGTSSSSCYTYATADKKTTFKGVFSPRAGGLYLIDTILNADIVTQKLNTLDQKACLTTWIIEENKSGDFTPCITVHTLDEASNLKPMKTAIKAEKFMNFLAKRKDLWSFFKIYDFQNENDDYINTASMDTLFLFSETESANRSEIFQIISYLSSKNYINMVSSHENTTSTPDSIVLTLEGKIATEQVTNENSDEGFIAMWFDKSMNNFSEAITKGIEQAGYKSIKIDDVEHNKKIDDEIIASIKRARFVVADFTHGEKDGARGSVYYEAGFAHGLEIPVIFTCREDMMDKVHFDTQQYNHITWKNEELDDLTKKIALRIAATIGDGPHKEK